MDYTGTFSGHVWNLGEIFVIVGMLEHTNSQFLWTITFIVTNNTVRSNVDSRRMRILRISENSESTDGDMHESIESSDPSTRSAARRSYTAVAPAHAGSMRSYCRLEIVHV